jgi:hypothetical protein
MPWRKNVRRRRLPAAVVLEPAVDVVRALVVERDLVELGERDGVHEVPAAAAVVARVDPAVAAEQHVVGVRGIDPERVEVAVDLVDHVGLEGLAAVLRVYIDAPSTQMRRSVWGSIRTLL